MWLTVSDLLKPDGPFYIEISQAFIAIDNRFLLQLRDFKPTIVYPGHWGFFAGHWETGETAEAAMRRELQEELSLQPQDLNFLGSFIVEGNRRIHVHKFQLNNGLESLTLQEGQEIGAFTKEEIDNNTLFSKKFKKYFPISPISAKVFKHFIVKETNAR